MQTILLVICAVLSVAVAALVFRLLRLTSQKTELETMLKVQKDFDAERAASQKLLAEEREKAFESQRKQMEESFKLLSEQNSAGLRRMNAESLTEILKPIQEKFTGFEKAVKENHDSALKQDATMQEALKHLSEQTANLINKSESVGNEARNLANALTGHSKIQGNFGEMLLVDLLKKSGLEEGVHFITQAVLRDGQGHEIKSDDGRTMIPDVIVYYPDDTEVIIDSKVSLNAYSSYMNAENVEERTRFAREHVASVRKHIDELKTKDYASYIVDGKRKVDYNIMFIPMEGAFRLMLEEEPMLWQLAKDSKVLIVSQMNLMIVLNMILMSWRQHDQEKNINDVYATAGELMSQLKAWMESYVKIGEYLDKARSSYDESKKKLMESNQSVIKKIDKLEHLKIGPKRSNAKIKPGARMVAGQESVIPAALAEGLDNE